MTPPEKASLKSNLGEIVDGALDSVGNYLAQLKNYRVVALAHIAILAIVIAAVFANYYPLNPFNQNLMQSLNGPEISNSEHFPNLLGTDPLGRDLMVRVLLATRISLIVGVLSVGIACVVGTTLGMLAGYLGGAVDAVVMRIVDALLALPFVVLGIAIVAAIGRSFFNIIFVLGFTGWITFAKLVRGQVLSLKEDEFIEAARAIGCSVTRILTRHVLPQVAGIVLVTITLTLGQMIISEATLSFLGVGIPPSIPTLGGILNDAQTYLFSAWWIVLFPGIVLMVIVLSFNLIGRFLRDYFDPQIDV
uniref:Binding-protein-dependent transport system inner membrane component n=1 Tax=uncultured organism TaxID=155900 RepID=M1PVI5_9ZZZZ|nr:binding-protein-dependent transport system inner membrane component [uncultured organism]